MTILDSIHPQIGASIDLRADELPLISFFAGDGDWTLYTTHRMIGALDEKRTELYRENFGATDFGNFKQDVDSPRVASAVIYEGGRPRTFLYESGYASMAPIHYFKFWRLKWPVWNETHRLESAKAEQGGGGNSASLRASP